MRVVETSRTFLLLLLLCSCSGIRPDRFDDWDGRALPDSGRPRCVAGGKNPEGWLQKDGSVKRDHCLDRVVYCSRVNTSAEGWYAAEVSSEQLINREKCSRSQNDRPECIQVSSYAEGWTAPSWTDRRVHWDDCRHKVVECLRIGSEEEGWWARMPKVDTAYLVKLAPCSDILRRDQWRWRR